tara:strand:+ start:2431 stop:3501 length:1071 start_codon:yes stop_codon:yes gene_type:complete
VALDPNAITGFGNQFAPGMTAEDEVWDEVKNWLARLRVLEGVPFNYIVSSEEMLPNESIRFFHIDRNWLDAMIDGALSVGMLDSRGALPSISDEENQELKYQDLLSDLDDLEVSREKFRVSNYTSFIGKNSLPTSQALTGFLLRSTVVRDYPGIEVSAFDAPNVGPENDDRWARKENRIQTIRQVRLSETILLCIFSGIPTHLRIQEPGEGLRLGLDPHNSHQCRYDLKYKNSDGQLANGLLKIRYRCKTGDRSVLSIKDILGDIAQGNDSKLPPASKWLDTTPSISNTVNSGGYVATQLMQFPYQQDFAYNSIRQEPYPDQSDEVSVHTDSILTGYSADQAEANVSRGGDSDGSA